jgi:toxin HigB-1
MQRLAYRKLRMLHRACSLIDLGSPPSNHLEKLKADRAGQHSIRINDRYRICFELVEDNALNVEIVNYH